LSRVVPLLVLAAIGVTSCASRRVVTVDFSEKPRAYLPSDYDAVYTRWTRHEYVLRDADKALEVWATMKSWDFREAYVARYAADYALTAADRETLRKGQLDSVRKYYEFHVTAQSADLKWNDLDKSNTAWRVALLDALGHELASEPVKLQRLPDAYERSFFPSKTAFTKTYSVRFIAPAEGDFEGAKSGALMLRFTSPIGRIELLWKS
jgi:hypothetical protein